MPDVVTQVRPDTQTATLIGGFAETREFGAASWSNVGSALASDNVSAISAMASGVFTDVLLAREFNFNVPNSANILGIRFTVEKSGQVGIEDNVVHLYENSVVKSGANDVNRAATGSWTIDGASIDYGGATDNWGQALTPAIVNSPNFGVVIGAINNTVDAAQTAYVDNITGFVRYGFPTNDAVAITTVQNNANYQRVVRNPTLPTVNLSGLVTKYENRFDDPTYYTA